MPWQKGQSGNPGGRTAEKPWRDALTLVLNEPVDAKDKTKKLRKVAEAVVNAAMSGDMTAAKEIGDRMDGKATQALTGADGGDLIVQLIKYGTHDTASE